MKQLSCIIALSTIFISSSFAQDTMSSQKFFSELNNQMAPTLAIPSGLSYMDVVSKFQSTVNLFTLEEDKKEQFNKQILASQPEVKFTKSEFFVVADRNPKNQIATLAYWNNDTKKVETFGYTKVSTGSVRQKHFYTPVGWFQNLPANGSYRAQGTKNENGIRGYGKKGMRVWDFGWVPSTSGYKKGLNIDIRFQMHATDPDHLESRLGTPDSQGCVRIHQSFNQFLDTYGIIDEEYEKINSWVLRKDRVKIQNAGTYLLVVDTGNQISPK